MIFGRSPDPGEVPDDAALFVGSETPVHFFDELAPGSRDDQTHAIAGARERPHGRRLKVAGNVEWMPLPYVFEAHGQDHGQTRLRAGECQLVHAWIGRTELPEL